jgi:uncharacterized metal-binding protein YceD (DUF177 family)
VNNPEEYRIAFAGLKPGTHVFDFEVGRAFFEAIGDDIISDGKVAVAISMVKEERMMDFHFRINGSVVVTCDRCTEPLTLEVGGDERLIVKLGDKYYEESEDIQVIPETDHSFDVAPFLYEYLHLMLPVRKVHPDDDSGNSLCDPAVLQKLEQLKPEPGPDPRWEVLRNLRQDDQS